MLTSCISEDSPEKEPVRCVCVCVCVRERERDFGLGTYFLNMPSKVKIHKRKKAYKLNFIKNLKILCEIMMARTKREVYKI